MDIHTLRSDLTEKGYAIVPGMDIATVERARSALLSLLQKLGVPAEYFNQPMVMDIKPQSGFQPASSGGQGYFDLHTDLSFHTQPPELLGTLSLIQDREGGDSLLADGYRVLKDFPEPKSRLREVLVTFPVPSHIKSGPVTQPIVTGPDEKPVIHFRSDLAPRSDPEVYALLETFSERARAVMQTFKLPPGHALILDNHRMLHGRTAITENPSQRHLIRAYANSPSSSARSWSQGSSTHG